MTKPLTMLLVRWTCALTLAAGMLGLTAISAHAEGRVPELVSNTDSNGSDVKDLMRPSADGHSISWFSLGASAGTRGANGAGVYVGRRTDSGWKVIPYWPDTKLVRPGISALIGGYLFSRDLSSMVASTGGQFDPGDTDGVVPDVYRFGASGSPTWVSRPQGVPQGSLEVSVVGVSDDGSTVFLTVGYGTFNTESLTPDVPAGVYQLYRWRDGALEAVGRDTDGSLILSTDGNAGGPLLGNGTSQVLAAGGSQGGRASDSFAVSSDGSRFVYRDVIGSSRYSRVFLHEDGVGDTEISLSQRSGSVGQRAPTGAIMLGGTPELRRIYLQSPDQLTDDAPAGGGDYVYDTATGRLSFSNPDNSVFEGDGKSGLFRISDDGEYVYFASTEVLASGAQLNASNLYVRHGDVTRFIGELRDGSVGVLPTTHGVGTPPYLAYTSTALSGDGSRFVFLSSVSLAGVDTGGLPQLYLYDAAADSLVCVSCRPDGSPSRGGASLGGESGDYLKPVSLPISADGKTVAFTSSDGLVAGDTNGAPDVYEYRDGKITLISGGTSRYPSTFEGLSPDATDLYFSTRDSLTSEDTNNGFRDFYDARIGGRIVPGNSGDQMCGGDDCQGPAAPRVRLADPGSEDFAGADDADDTAPPQRAATLRVREATSSSTLVTVKVQAPGAGEIQASGNGLTAIKRSVTRAATYTVKLKLSAGSRQTLQKRGRLVVRVRVRFVPAEGKAVLATANVTIKRSARSSRKGR